MNYWFVFDAYRVSGRPKAEDAVMEYACANYLHTLIAEEELDNVGRDLNAYMEKRLAENRRLSPATIALSMNPIYENYRTFDIGNQCLRLVKVKAIIRRMEGKDNG